MKSRKRLPISLWVVQQTKLIPPSKARALVERDRLMSPAMAGARTRLLLITAAAGYGKTSVLVQLYETLAQQRRQLCWISLDAADNDHVRFLAHLVAGLRGAVPTFGAELALMLGSAAGAPASVLRSRLLNELTAIDDDLYLFLDDYHAIADPEVRDTLAAILLAPLPRIHLLIATRNRNEMPVGRLLALGQMVEIGASRAGVFRSRSRPVHRQRRFETAIAESACTPASADRGLGRQPAARRDRLARGRGCHAVSRRVLGGDTGRR